MTTHDLTAPISVRFPASPAVTAEVYDEHEHPESAASAFEGMGATDVTFAPKSDGRFLVRFKGDVPHARAASGWGYSVQTVRADLAAKGEAVIWTAVRTRGLKRCVSAGQWAEDVLAAART